MSSNNIILVYGTLKAGFGNHHLLARSRFIGAAVSAASNYRMFGNGTVPRVQASAVDGAHVAGELYIVDAATLVRCDRLEGHPLAYQRELHEFITANGERIRAWIYLWQHHLNDYEEVQPIGEPPTLSWPRSPSADFKRTMDHGPRAKESPDTFGASSNPEEKA